MKEAIRDICLLMLVLCLGLQVANLQTRRALAGWNHTLADNAKLLDLVNETTKSLKQQNAAVEELLAEKRAAWGIIPPRREENP